MCWSEKCCFCVRLDVGCLLIGFATLFFSLILMVFSIWSLEISEDILNIKLVHFELKHVTKEAIFIVLLIVSMFWMSSSLLLIVGVKTGKTGFVLIYFAYGIFMTFFMLLSSLLLLLQSLCMVAFILIGASMIYIHSLVAVHTFYELHVRGKIFVEPSADGDNEILVTTA